MCAEIFFCSPKALRLQKLAMNKHRSSRETTSSRWREEKSDRETFKTLLDESTVFTVKIPGSRDRKDIWRSRLLCWTAWHRISKNYATSHCAFGPSLAGSNHRSQPPIDPTWIQAPPRGRNVPVSALRPTRESGGGGGIIHKLRFQISKTISRLFILICLRCLPTAVAFAKRKITKLLVPLSVQLTAGLKSPLGGAAINVKARLHPGKNVAHLSFAAAGR